MKIRLRYQVLAFTVIRIVINTLFRLVYPFMPVIGRGLNVEFKRLSQAIGWRGLMGFFGPLYAWLADTKGRKTGMIVGLLIFSAGMGVIILWPTFWGFTAMLILTTIGKFSFDPAMHGYLGDRVMYKRRAFVLGITELGWSGAFFGVFLAGILMDRLGWMSPFPVILGLSLLGVVALMIMLPSDKDDAASRQNLTENIKSAFSSRYVIAGLMVTLTVSLSNEFVNLTFGSWLEDDFGMKITALGLAAAVIGVAELSSELMVSGFVDRIGKRRAVGIGITASTFAAGMMPFIAVNETWAFVALFIYYLAFEFTFVSAIPMMTELLPSARATVMAGNIACASIGRTLGAWAVPAVFAQGFTLTALVSGAVNLLALVALSQVRVAGED